MPDFVSQNSPILLFLWTLTTPLSSTEELLMTLEADFIKETIVS